MVRCSVVLARSCGWPIALSNSCVGARARLQLNDLGSANGTLIGEFAQSRKLAAAENILPGQIFRVGLTRFRLENVDSQIDQVMAARQQ